MGSMVIAGNTAKLLRKPQGGEVVDEAFYGQRVKGLRVWQDWCCIRTFYGYDGWVRKNQLTEEASMENCRRMFLSNLWADVLKKPNVRAERILCLPMGAEVAWEEGKQENGYERLRLADGSCGYVPKPFLREQLGEKERKEIPEEELRKRIVTDARRFLKVQYRWGGKTAEGIDCSGLAQIAYLMNSIVIYRDAKIAPGFPVHKIPLDQMKMADLIYFKGHVAVYLGNDQYIHATGKAGVSQVCINSLCEKDENYREDLAKGIVAAGSVFS